MISAHCLKPTIRAGLSQTLKGKEPGGVNPGATRGKKKHGPERMLLDDS